MKTMLAMLLTLLSLSPTAQARPWPTTHPSAPPATVLVDNDAGESVDVWIDGVFRGEVRRGDARTFSTLPGHRTVLARTDSGYVLHDTRVQMHPHRSTRVVLTPLLLDLTLMNRGDMPLLVSIPGQRDFWMTPGARQTLPLRAGSVPVTTKMATFRGLVTLDTQRVDLFRDTWIDLGRRGLPTEVTLTNHERRSVRVHLGGREVAHLAPGRTTTLTVQPGREIVTLTDSSGRLLYNGPVSFEADARFALHFDGGIRTLRLQDAGRGYDTPRRPGHGSDCSCGSCAMDHGRPLAMR